MTCLSRRIITLLISLGLSTPWGFGTFCQAESSAGLEVDQIYVRSTCWQTSMLRTRKALLASEATASAKQRVCSDVTECLARDFPVESDWFHQDAGPQVTQWFLQSQTADLERRMIRAALSELGPKGQALAARHKRMVQSDITANDRQWLDLYVEACKRRREARLRRVTATCPAIVFTKHYDIGGSHYAYTEGISDALAERHFTPGTRLCLWQADDHFGKVRTLIHDPNGVIRDPDVSYDGKRILFSWKKSDREDDYHLYEMEVATGKVRQLTFGLGFADYEGNYLPNGDIIFNSTRCGQSVDCASPEVSNLYTCDSNGQYMRRLGVDQVHTNFPTVTPDGRIIYTRWDYNDRGQLYPQPLFQMNPDGTNQTEVYGNNSWFPTTIMHARAIPDSHRIVAILSGHHSHQRGKLAVIDTHLGRQEAAGVQLIAPVRETEAVRVDAYGQGGEQFQYPYPLNGSEFLVTYTPVGSGNRRYTRPFGIYHMDVDGRRELLAFDPDISSNQPVPLAPRTIPHVRPRQTDYRQNEGVYYLHDIYNGPGLKGVARGTIKALRVIKLEYRAASIRANFARGPGGAGHANTPVSIGSGTWDVKVVLGDATVYEDGSACFKVPARTSVYFQALDAKGHAVQTMRSWSTLQPGETLSCVGCHEDKNVTPGNYTGKTLALDAGPETLKPFYGPPRGFSFIREIQPILDRHCIGCHKDRTKRLHKADTSGTYGSLDPAKARMLSNREETWRYMYDRPGNGWHRPEFDDSGWSVGRGGFGSPGTPGGTIHTTWRARNIWLRRTFELKEVPKGRNLLLWLAHDEDVEIFINGVPAAKATNYITAFKALQISPEAAKALRSGTNVLAVHCRHGAGGQFIDVALADAGPLDLPPVPNEQHKDLAFSLLGEQTPEEAAGRKWSDSYLALTQPTMVGGYLSGRSNRLVSWIGSQSVPTMLPPYHAGAAKSQLIEHLEKGHQGVTLSQEELDKIACWIDLLVPYCGDYLEANIWTDQELRKYEYYLQKRIRMERFEQENIARLIRDEGL